MNRREFIAKTAAASAAAVMAFPAEDGVAVPSNEHELRLDTLQPGTIVHLPRGWKIVAANAS